MTEKESRLVALLSKKKGWSEVKTARRSDREFDLDLSGWSTDMDCSFSAWLPLASVGNLSQWRSEEVADHAKTAKGDWTSLSESGDETIWSVFRTFVDII